MRGQESIQSTGTNTAPANFTVSGGRYQLDVVITGTSVQLFGLGPDGTTKLSHGSAITTNGSSVVELAPGTYGYTFTAITAFSLALTRIPGE